MAERLVVSPEIQELRSAMERVRAVHETASIDVNLARYDVATEDINTGFLSGLLEILPVTPGYNGNYANEVIANHFRIDDPLDVRAVASFGAITTRDEAGFIIGEKPATGPDHPLTDVLIAGWQRSSDEEGFWQPPQAYIRPVKLVGKDWTTLRDRAIGSLAQPYDVATLMGMRNHKVNKFCINRGSAEQAGLTVISQMFTNGSDLRPKKQVKHLGWQSDIAAGTISGYFESHRTLRSSDFAEYDVMRHLEYLAAAFGVGEQFDAIKAEREAQMPQHPVHTMFELPDDYRQALEGPNPLAAQRTVDQLS